MTIRISFAATIVLLGLMLVCPVNTGSEDQPLSWITGYWFSPPAWGGLPVSDVDYSALTHIIHHAVLPRSDGTLEPKSLKYVTDYAPDLIKTAHENGVKVLLCVAQSQPDRDFTGATTAGILPRLIASIMDLVEAYGYDGVDVVWEREIDSQQFGNLVSSLRSRLDFLTPRGLLTGAFWETGRYLTEMQNAFDQINVMTYDMCSPEDGFSWHNSALFDAGDGRRRTVSWRMSRFVSEIAGSKLGLGIPFYGYAWQGGAGTPTNGVTAPGQNWSVPPSMHSLSYRDIVSDPTLWREEHKQRHDAAGKVPYLSIGPLEPKSAGFVTYDDETSVTEKVLYARTHGFGGVMIWELSGDYLPHRSPKHPLLQAVKTASRGS